MIILCDGNIIFNGPPEEIGSRIEALGFSIPKFTSPTDFIMKIIDKDEIKVEYEKKNEDLTDSQKVIDSLYQQRLNFFTNYESSVLKLKRGSLEMRSSSNFDKEDETQDSMFTLDELEITPSPEDKEMMQQLEIERKIRNRPLGLFSQYIYLLWLYMSYFYTRKSTYLIIIAQIVIGNLLFLAVFKDLGDPEDDTIIAISNRLGFCYIMNLQGTFAGLNSSLLNFISGRKLFKKDKDARIYSELPFFLTQLTFMIPIYLIIFFGVTFMYYYLVGLNRDPVFINNALYTYFFMFVGGYISGQSFSILLGSLSNSMSTASALTPLIIAPLSISAGYMCNLKSASFPIRWIAYLSSMRFSYQGYALVEFQNSQRYVDSCYTYVDCPTDPSKRCRIKIPDFAKRLCDPMQITDFIQTDILTNVYFILGLIVFFRFLGCAIFKLKSSQGQMRYKQNPFLKKKIQNQFKFVKKLSLVSRNERQIDKI